LIRFVPDGLDTDFFVGVRENDNNTNDDIFVIGQGTTVGASSYFVITSTGSIGIGISAPVERFTILTNSNSDLTLLMQNTNGGSNADVGAVLAAGTNLGIISAQSPTASVFPDKLYIGSLDLGTGSGIVLQADDATGDIDFYTGGSATSRMYLSSDGTLGIGTTSPGVSTILDLSATNAALRVTRLDSPTVDIATPVNGMIVYDSGDDELQAYIGGTWSVIQAGASSDIFVLTAGDSMSGTLDMNFADAAIRFIPAVAGDSDFWIGVQDDGAGDDNDEFSIGTGTTVGSGTVFTITTTGTLEITLGAGNSGGVPAGTVVQIPTIQQKDITLIEPDQIRGVNINVPMFTVDSFNYPNGITITGIRLATNASSTYDVDVEEFSDPATSAELITTISTSASTEATDITFTASEAAIPSGSYIFVQLNDTDNIDWAKLTVWYYVTE